MERIELETVTRHALEFYLALTKLEDVKRQGYVD